MDPCSETGRNGQRWGAKHVIKTEDWLTVRVIGGYSTSRSPLQPMEAMTDSNIDSSLLPEDN